MQKQVHFPGKTVYLNFSTIVNTKVPCNSSLYFMFLFIFPGTNAKTSFVFP